MTGPLADPAQKLERMAHQIATFFAAYPEAEAASATAAHINKFWSRRMREDFLAHFAQDDERLTPLLRAARRLIRPAPPPRQES